jgi:chromate reductase, NAD(P)H dehydrogenase (quinone)
MNFLLFSGSFHSSSRSLVVLDTILPYLQGHNVETPKLDALPFFCEDLNKNKPDNIRAFLAKVTAADAIICCTPEYNHSIPAVLKNALDWASRPAFNSPLKGKAVSIITQAASAVGGARAQAHLKLVLDSTLSTIHICHEMMIPDIDKLIANKKITDEKVLQRLERHTRDFVRFVEEHKK